MILGKHRKILQTFFWVMELKTYFGAEYIEILMKSFSICCFPQYNFVLLSILPALKGL